jgi:hypothetical protein
MGRTTNGRGFPWDTAPQYLLRDLDAIYGEHFCRRVQSLLIEEVITAPRSLGQNPYVERIKVVSEVMVGELAVRARSATPGARVTYGVSDEGVNGIAYLYLKEDRPEAISALLTDKSTGDSVISTASSQTTGRIIRRSTRSCELSRPA